MTHDGRDGTGIKALGLALGAGLAAALALTAGAAEAQLSAQKGPIDVTGDHMDIRSQEHVVEWKGRVEALQGDDRLRSNVLNIYYKSKAGAGQTSSGPGADFGDIDRMEAIGDVYFVTPTQVARGDKAVYTAADNTIVISGNVVVTQGENVGRGTRLIIDLANNRSTMEGGPSGRPRVIYYPPKKSQGPSR